MKETRTAAGSTERVSSRPGAELQSQLRGSEQLLDAARHLSAARDLDGIMAAVRTFARGVTGADGASLVLRDGDFCFYADEDSISPLWKGRRFPIDSCISGWVMLNGQPVVIPDVFADERVPHEVYRTTFVKSLAMVPIGAAEPIGAIGNYWASPRQPTDDQVRMLQALADLAYLSIENVRLYERLREQVRDAEQAGRRASALQQITAELSRRSSLAEVSEVVVAKGAEAIGAATGGLWLVGSGGQYAELVSSVSYSERAEDFRRIPLDTPLKTPVVDTILDAQPRWVHGRASFAAAYPDVSQMAKARPEMAIASLPMMVNAQCIGALAFTFDEVRLFTDDERDFLMILAQHCAQAVERARLFDRERDARSEAEAAQRRSAFLLEASSLLSSSLDFQETLHRLAELAVPRIADWCLVEMADEPGGPIRLLTAEHVDPSRMEAAREYRLRYPLHPDAPRGVPRVIRTGEPELYEEIDDELLVASIDDAEHLRLIRQAGMRSVMIAPISARDRTFGAITFVSVESGRTFNRADLELAELLGRRAGIAIDNALLYDAAQREARAREEVLAVVSHDLRNPLAAVVMNASVLQSIDVAGATGARMRKGALSIQRAAERMSLLIDDLVDFSAIRGGGLSINPRQCSANEIVSATLDMFSALADDRELKLERRTPEGDIELECDRDRIIQALGNLVANSIKVTPAGGAVRVGFERDANEVVFWVEDSGPGLSKDELARAFDRYWRSDRTSYKGAGLGLAIAKGIVDAHRGRIWAESRLGEGSRFLIALPAS